MKTRHLLLIGTGVAAFTVQSSILAQTAPSAPATGDPGNEASATSQVRSQPSASNGKQIAIEEQTVIVSGHRWETLQDGVAPVIKYTAEDRNLLSINTAADLVNLTPGFVYTDSYGINVRGVGRQTPQSLLGQENAVTQYVDGFIQLVPSNIAESTLFGGNVQFSSGPQGTRYGRNALAGAVNLVSRAPTQQFTGEAEAGIGRGGFNIEGVNIAGPITSELGARLGFERMEAPSTTTNIGSAKGAGFAQKNDYLEFQLEWAHGPFHIRTRSTSFRFDNQPGYTSPAKYDTTTLFGGLGPNPQFRYDVPSPTAPHTINVDYAGYDKLRNNFQQIINADLNLGSATLYYVGGYQQYHSLGSSDLDLTSRSSYATLRTDPFVAGTVVPTFYTANYDNNNRFFSHELRLESSKAGALQYVVGTYYYNQNFNEQYWEAIPGSGLLATPTIGAPGGTTAANPLLATFQQRNIYKIRSLAGFGNVQYAFSPQWGLDGGLRYTRDDKNAVTNFRYVYSYPPLFAGDVTPAAHGATPSERDEGTSGHIDLAWRPNSRTDAYVSYSRGYQSSAFTLGQGVSPNNIAAPEHLDVYEIGVQTKVIPQLTIGGSLFDQKLHDMQIPISTRTTDSTGKAIGPVYSNFVNAKLATISGFQANATWVPSTGANVTLNYTHLQSKFSSFCPPARGSNSTVCGAIDITEPAASAVPQDLTGNQVPRTPRDKVALYGYKTFSVGSMGKLIPGASVTYEGAYYVSAFEKSRFLVPAHTVINLTTTFRTNDNRFDLVASVTNALGKDYAQDVAVANRGGSLLVTPALGADRFYSLIGRYRF